MSMDENLHLSLMASVRVDDRKGWPAGPWDAEGDKSAWVEPSTGYACRIERCVGHLNGYVTIPATHPDVVLGTDFAGVVRMHGGVTWQESIADGVEIGFDTGHAGDLYPRIPAESRPPGKYRDWAYVVAETVQLAQQLHARAQSREAHDGVWQRDAECVRETWVNVSHTMKIVNQHGRWALYTRDREGSPWFAEVGMVASSLTARLVRELGLEERP